jgi:hypothetical protein
MTAEEMTGTTETRDAALDLEADKLRILKKIQNFPIKKMQISLLVFLLRSSDVPGLPKIAFFDHFFLFTQKQNHQKKTKIPIKTPTTISTDPLMIMALHLATSESNSV